MTSACHTQMLLKIIWSIHEMGANLPTPTLLPSRRIRFAAIVFVCRCALAMAAFRPRMPCIKPVVAGPTYLATVGAAFTAAPSRRILAMAERALEILDVHWCLRGLVA